MMDSNYYVYAGTKVMYIYIYFIYADMSLSQDFCSTYWICCCELPKILV